VVTINTLDGTDIESYAVALYKQWGIGSKATDHGVLILLAVQDHKYRIEVGYGLEPILTDGKVGGFGREAVPLLRQNDYNGAVSLMTARVADVIAQDAGIQLTGDRPQFTSPQSAPQRGLSGKQLLILGVILLIILFTPLRSVLFWILLSGLGGGGGGGYRGRWWRLRRRWRRFRRIRRRQFRRRRRQRKLVAVFCSAGVPPAVPRASCPRRMQSRLRRKQRQTGGTPILHRLAKQEVSQMVAEKQIDEFVSRMKQAAGQNLQSIVLYGSAATGEFQADFSNLNLLCILRETSFSKLSAISPVVEWWHRQKNPAPLIMTQEELEHSTDVFSIEFLDMQHHHRVSFRGRIAAPAANPHAPASRPAGI
jgi:uncharacterized membrane protein YgcG